MSLRSQILAGCVLIVTQPNGQQHTYRIRHSPARGIYREAWFVQYERTPGRAGYLGVLDDFTGQTRLTDKSLGILQQFPLHLLNRLLARVWSDDHESYERHGWTVRAEACEALMA